MNGVTTVIQDNMKCCIYNKIRRGRVTYGKERFRMYIFYGLKISQNFEMEIFKGKMGRRNISRKIILKNSKGIC